MKAYVVTETVEGFSEVVFAETYGQAKARSEFAGTHDYTELRASREPRFDKYAESGSVPQEALLENNWWFRCEVCGLKKVD